MPSRLPTALARAVDALFDAALFGGSLAAGLDVLADAMGAAGAALVPLDPERISVALPVSRRLTDVLAAFVAGGWHLSDPRSQRGFKRIAAGGSYVTDAVLFTPEERRSLACFGDFYNPIDLPGFAGISFFAERQYWSLTMLRGRLQPEFDDAELQGYLPVAPYMRRIVTMAARFQQRADGQLIEVASLLGNNAILLDAQGGSLVVSAEAEALLGDGLSLRRGRLESDDSDANRLLQALIERVTNVRSPAEQGAINVVAVPRLDRRPLLVEAISLPRAARDVFSRAAAILLIDESEPPPPDARLLASVFGLTPAEAAVAALIGRGESPVDAAAALGKGVETVRTLLKRVYGKIGVRRQSELAALIAAVRTKR